MTDEERHAFADAVCRASFSKSCASCNTELRAGAKFCDACGTPAGTGESGTGGEPQRSPRDYTPKHLADKILQSKSALEGERKQVTVFFADVKGSMALAEQLDPEEWHRILERFFEILTDGVHRFEGTVNQYTGDGIMALFGAPIAHEDHAQRACFAALHLQGEIARYAIEVKREHGVGFSTRMGINSGEVVVGRIGTDLRMDYTAQGHTVGLAQRASNRRPVPSDTTRGAKGHPTRVTPTWTRACSGAWTSPLTRRATALRGVVRCSETCGSGPHRRSTPSRATSSTDPTGSTRRPGSATARC